MSTYDDPADDNREPEDLFKEGVFYPQWICYDCGEKYGRRLPELATWHTGECDICGFTNAVTEPRDFGHLKVGWEAFD